MTLSVNAVSEINTSMYVTEIAKVIHLSSLQLHLQRNIVMYNIVVFTNSEVFCIIFGTFENV